VNKEPVRVDEGEGEGGHWGPDSGGRNGYLRSVGCFVMLHR